MWLFLAVVAKAVLYCAACNTIALVFSRWLLSPATSSANDFLHRQGCKTLALLLFTLAAGFLLQVGQTSASGLVGMFDSFFASLIWQSSVGDALQWRLASCLFLFLSLFFWGKNWSSGLLLASAVAMAASFAFTGHTVAESVWLKLSVVAHVLAVGLWIGSLLPLLWFAKSSNQLYAPLHLFGQRAAVMVTVLVISGSVLLLFLPAEPNQILRSTWGGTLLFKIGLVAILLLLAAQNRFSIVPSLGRNEAAGDSAAAFRLTVVFELILALLVLLVTATVTSTMGPPTLS